MSWLRRHRAAAGLVALAAVVWLGAFQWALDREMAPSAAWIQDLEAYERLDATNPPPDRAVLFVGSSSIRLWSSLRGDFPRYRVFRRGFNGARIDHMSRHVDDLVAPYDPEMVILYAGDNDLADGLKPREVLLEYQSLVDRVRREVPTGRVGILSIKPSPSRWHLVRRIRETNRRLKEWCERHDWLDFIDVHTGMLDEHGRPRTAYFESDGLHPSPRGYSAWADRIRGFLPETARRTNLITPTPPSAAAATAQPPPSPSPMPTPDPIKRGAEEPALACDPR
ncbi:MAG: GDSL-type esterase/lipase family protein [Limisphaerales bacterium]